MSIRSDSEVARRIVRSFLEFLGSVQLAPEVDAEGLEVASQCLVEAFRLQSTEEGSAVPLVELFTRREEPTKNAGSGVSKQEAYEQFIDGLESSGYFQGESERTARLAQAKSTFDDTLKAFKGQDQSDLLAEAFKAQGNAAMAARRYTEAVELYTLAISICGNNAIYFANRAAAHTQAGNPSAAVNDCYKAIDINPQYSKPYGRLGLVNYSQGRYFEAAEWFSRALEVDPSNTSARENLEATQRKLEELRMSPSWATPGSGRQSETVPGIVNVSAQFEPRHGESAMTNSSEFELENFTVSCEAEVPLQQDQQDQREEEQEQRSSNMDEGAAQEFASRLRSALQSVLGGMPQAQQ